MQLVESRNHIASENKSLCVQNSQSFGCFCPTHQLKTQHNSKSPKLQIIFTQPAVMTDVFYFRYTVPGFLFFSKFCLICGLVKWSGLFSGSLQWGIRTMEGPWQGSVPIEALLLTPMSPPALLWLSWQVLKPFLKSCAEDIFPGSSSLMAGSTSSLMANPANPLHSGLRGLGWFSIQDILQTIKTEKTYSYVGAF